MAQVYIYSDKVYFLCQVKDLCKLINQYACRHKTVEDLINATFNRHDS
ncbi:hypothetical protein [Desulforamulus hydrothermalis]|nr:hypothetical protein [Desulforamulus hydrothermalis]SHG75470.1 hypothetical protein SAMN02745177_00266 [Desulforamulus hydrothermalis Lam5 = DSM 18033]